MQLNEIERWSKIAYYGLAGLGVVAAGFWTYRRYLVSREGTWNLRIDIDHTVHAFDDHQALLVLRVTLQNVGRVVVRPGTKGCRISLRTFPKSERPNMSVLDWNDGTPGLTDWDVISNRPSAKDGIRYEIEPSCSYTHVVAVVVPRSIIIMTRATFWWKDDKDAVNATGVTDSDVLT